MLNTKLKKGAAPLKPQDLIELSFDKKEIRKGKIKNLYTKEEYQNLKKQLGLNG